MITAEAIARDLGQGREKRTPTGWSTLCPAHDDHNPSLDVDEKGGSILVNCRVGCEQSRVIDTLRDRGLWPSAGANGNGNGAAPRLTLAQLAEAKGFSSEFLEQHGITEKEGVVHFLYLQMNGQRSSRQRLRASLGVRPRNFAD